MKEDSLKKRTMVNMMKEDVKMNDEWANTLCLNWIILQVIWIFCRHGFTIKETRKQIEDKSTISFENKVSVIWKSQRVIGVYPLKFIVIQECEKHGDE